MSLRGSETDESILALQAGDCVASLAMTSPRHLQFNHHNLFGSGLEKDQEAATL